MDTFPEAVAGLTASCRGRQALFVCAITCNLDFDWRNFSLADNHKYWRILDHPESSALENLVGLMASPRKRNVETLPTTIAAPASPRLRACDLRHVLCGSISIVFFIAISSYFCDRKYDTLYARSSFFQKHLDVRDVTRTLLQMQAASLDAQHGSLGRIIPENFDPFNTDSTVNIWDMFLPTLACPDVERVGRVGDGGKWICGLEHLQTRREPPCVIYSMGISDDISFEVDMLRRTPCHVFAFDPSIGGLPFSELPAGELRNASLRENIRSRLHFYKSAFSARSGPNDVHSVAESLFDIMHRLGHPFVDILKVDIEGGEWPVFAGLEKTKPLDLPVGQLSIELHYSNNTDIEMLFRATRRWGLHPFSREINLQPCLAGNKPHAAEYSFINPDSYYRGRKKHSIIQAAQTPLWHDRINGAIYMLSMKSRAPRLKRALSLTFDNFWKYFPHYPILIFHDDFSAVDEAEIQQHVSNFPLRFARVAFDVPANVKGLISERTTCDPKASTVGYRHMCRFHAYGAHREIKSLLGHVDYIWRLDDDSALSSPIGYDVFRFMHTNHYKYGFVNALPDAPECVLGLWEQSRAFAKLNLDEVSADQFLFDWPDPLTVYNNFEISHTSIWEHPLWLKYIDFIEELGGIYLHRWGDAPIHTIAAAMILGIKDLHAFTDIAYVHEPFARQKARGLPMPGTDPFRSSDVTCTYFNSWKCENSSATNVTNSTFNLTAPLPSRPSAAGDKYQRGVLFTFGHRGREEFLVASITSFHVNFAARFEIPFAVFYNSKNTFDSRKVDFLARSTAMRVVLLPVELPRTIATNSYCSSADPEVNDASVFLRFKASRTLTVMGYHWHWRFGDDSKLLQPVMFNVFERMAVKDLKYGYLSTLMGRSECVDSLWELGDRICETMPCSPFYKKWSRGRIVLTNFEITSSLFGASPACKLLFDVAQGKSSRFRSLINDTASEGWSDSSLHTLCAILSLTEEEVYVIDDILYHFNWNTETQSADPDRAMQLHRFTASSIPYFDSVFEPQRLGWLGGDIATSVLLPQNPRDRATSTRRAVWLFGDSLLGLSSVERRQKTHSSLVSNTVAIAIMDGSDNCLRPDAASSDRAFQNVKFSWRTDKVSGLPAPIFELNEADRGICGDDQSRASLWPIAAIVVENAEGIGFKLVVVCQIACGVDTGRAASLDFEHPGTVLVVVRNPDDGPDMWEYDYAVLPQHGRSLYSWVSVCESNGASLAAASGTVYILGTHLADKATHLSSSNSQHVMLRIRASSLAKLEFADLELLCSGVAPSAQPFWRPWADQNSQDGDVPHALFGPITTEASLLRQNGLWRVVSLSFTEKYIRVCEAKDPSSLWECNFVAEVDPQWQTIEMITYAAKAHPEISPCVHSNENGMHLVVSFVSNSFLGPDKLFESGFRNIYTPKFVRIKDIRSLKNSSSASTMPLE